MEISAFNINQWTTNLATVLVFLFTIYVWLFLWRSKNMVFLRMVVSTCAQLIVFTFYIIDTFNSLMILGMLRDFFILPSEDIINLTEIGDISPKNCYIDTSFDNNTDFQQVIMKINLYFMLLFDIHVQVYYYYSNIVAWL